MGFWKTKSSKNVQNYHASMLNILDFHLKKNRTTQAKQNKCLLN